MTTTPGYEQRLAEIARTTEEFARERGYVFSRNKDRILQEMARMYERFGNFYCPCQAENTDDTICVCTEVRQGYVEEMGRCHCNLFRQA